MNETKLQQSIQDWITARGGKVIKIHGNEMQVGEPDLIGGITFYFRSQDVRLSVSVPFVAETKVGRGNLSPLQKIKLEFWSNAGFNIFVPYSLHEFEEQIIEAAWLCLQYENPDISASELLSWELV